MMFQKFFTIRNLIILVVLGSLVYILYTYLQKKETFSLEEDKIENSNLSEQEEFLLKETKNLTSDDLLPKSEQKLNENFLISDFKLGMDTRNNTVPNLQLRSDPVVPRLEVNIPFNSPSIQKQDTMRRRLEIN